MSYDELKARGVFNVVERFGEDPVRVQMVDDDSPTAVMNRLRNDRLIQAHRGGRLRPRHGRAPRRACNARTRGSRRTAGSRSPPSGDDPPPDDDDPDHLLGARVAL
jgi:hypothetical protein